MQRMSGVYRDAFGKPISGATVTVYNAGTSTLATIYQASGSESTPAGQSNPFTTDSTGAWSFAVQNGYYDIQVSSSSAATEYYWNQYFTDAGSSTIANPMTTQGDMIGGSVGGVIARIPANSTSTPKYVYEANGAFPIFKQPDASESTFTQTGTGTVASTLQAKLNESLSTKDFGAVGDGVTDDTVALQAAITAAIIQGKRLHWNAGTYKISSPLLVGSWNGTAWAFASCTIEGEVMAWDSVSSTVTNVRVTPTFNDKPAIMIQAARAVTIKNVAVIGTNDVKSVISASAPANYFKMMTIGNFNQNASRDQRYSPYAGIVIDPFGTSVPADGGYPGLTSYYVASAASSSYVRFENCVVENFIVGVAMSPNGVTLGDENVTFDNCQINYCKVGLSLGQSQSRNVAWRNGAVAFCYYCFDGRSYGIQQAYAPKVFGGNFAGKYLLNVGSNWGETNTITGAYCESIASIGFIGADSATQYPAVFLGCSFGFNDWSGVGPQADNHLYSATPVEFQSCTFSQGSMTNPGPLRFYHTAGTPIVFSACTGVGSGNLEQFFAPSRGVDGTEWDRFHFRDCIVTASSRGSSLGLDSISETSVGYDFGSGNLGSFYMPRGARVKLSNTTNSIYADGSSTSENKINLGSIAVTLGTNAQATFTAPDATIIRQGDLIYCTGLGSAIFDGPGGPATFAPNFLCIGQVSSVVGSVVTINGVPQSFQAGTYTLYLEWMSRYHQASLGDTSSGTNTILNVTNASTWKIGNRIKGSGIPSGAYITNVVGTTVTISKNATGTNTQTPLYDANLYQLVATDSNGNSTLGGTTGVQTINGIFNFTNGTYAARMRFAGGGSTLFQFGTQTSGVTNFGVGMGAVSSSLGAWHDMTSAGVHNFYVGTTSILAANFDATGNFNPKFYTSAAVGTPVASAATITPTGPVFHVTGTAAISTINLPYVGFTGTIRIIADGAWSTTTSGNIGSSIIAVANQEYAFTYDGSKWYATSYGSAGGVVSAAPVNPTGTTSLTPVMMGLAVSITPTRTGRIAFTVSGQMVNNTNNDGANVQLRYGTGTAPINGAAGIGSLAGNNQTFTAAAANGSSGFSISPIITGLTIGTPYWFDLALNAVTGGTATVTGITASAHEI